MHKSKFLGLSKDFKGYKVLDLTDRVIKYTRDFKNHSLHEEELVAKAFNTNDKTLDQNASYGNWPTLEEGANDNTDDSMTVDIESVGVTDKVQTDDNILDQDTDTP